MPELQPSATKDRVVLKCVMYGFGKRKLKSKEQFSHKAAEKFYEKAGKCDPVRYEVKFTQNRVRFNGYKLGIQNKRHPTVLYENIKGAYSIHNHPNHLILGIEYPEKKKAKFEIYVFAKRKEADRAKDILLAAKRHQDGVYQGEAKPTERPTKASKPIEAVVNEPTALLKSDLTEEVTDAVVSRESLATPDSEAMNKREPLSVVDGSEPDTMEAEEENSPTASLKQQNAENQAPAEESNSVTTVASVHAEDDRNDDQTELGSVKSIKSEQEEEENDAAVQAKPDGSEAVPEQDVQSNGSEENEMSTLVKALAEEHRDSVIYVGPNNDGGSTNARRGSVYLYCMSSQHN